jgi:heterodisulfide reductase subunit C
VAFESSDTPRKIIRFLQQGEVERACQSPFIWFCTSCQACSVRCPQGVDILGVMLQLRRMGVEKGWVGKQHWYYRTFASMIEKKGKIDELRLGLSGAFHKVPLHPIEDALLLFKLWRRGKI